MLYDVLEQSLPFYNMLKTHARRTRFPKLPKPSLPVPSNEKILVWVGDEILTRDMATVVHLLQNCAMTMFYEYYLILILIISL